MRAPEPQDASTRRGFLGNLTFALGGIPILGGLVATMRAGLSPAASERPARIPLCKESEVPAEGIKEVAVSFPMRQGPVMESEARVVFVTRDPGTKEILALSGECTHLGCPVQNRELTVSGDVKAPLTCPCHGGMFSATGKRLAGPPKDDLPRLKFEKGEGDMLFLVEA